MNKASRPIRPSYQQLGCKFVLSPPFSNETLSYETAMTEKPKFLIQVRQVIRVKNYLYHTEQAYVVGSNGTFYIMTSATRPGREQLQQKRFPSIWR